MESSSSSKKNPIWKHIMAIVMLVTGLFLAIYLTVNDKDDPIDHSPPKPVDYKVWSTPIKNGSCQDVVYNGNTIIKCVEQKRTPEDGGTPIIHKEYYFSAGIFEIDEQILIPENVSIIGVSNPNGDPQKGISVPNHDKTTLFLATKGVTDYNKPYCKAKDMVKTRVGFVLSGHNTIKNIAYQGIDTIRPRDNGTLCGGGVFETKGCAEHDCMSNVNNAGSDGKGSTDVLIENVRLNDYYFKEDQDNIGVDIPGNNSGCNDGCDGCKLGSCCFCKANNVRSTQTAVWVPQTRDADGTRNITVKNLVSRSNHADGINLHGYVNKALVENTVIENTGDDSYAVWGANSTPENIVFRNTTAVNPGVMRPNWYGVCYATYGFKNVNFDGVTCRTPILPTTISKDHLISTSMISFNNSFGAKYPDDNLATISNGWNFTDLDGEKYTVEDGVKNTMDTPKPGKMVWTKSNVSDIITNENKIGPFYFTDNSSPLNIKIN